MGALRDQIERRFPEVRETLDEEDGDYTLMHRVVEWLRATPRETLSSEIVGRLRAFIQWCEEQPRTESPEDDIYTIFVVGFWEHLFESDSTRSLIPQLKSREEVTANGDYLKSWVGAENYQMAIAEYDRNV